MKPKTRYPQKQERRLLLRDKDHRDIILNDTYVNSLWMKKDGKDELVWQRYPRLYNLMFMRDASGYPAGNYFTVLDVDREIAHSIPWANGYLSKEMRKLDDLMILHSEYMTTEPFRVSFDGLNWGKMSTSVSGFSNYVKFGNDNSMVSFWGGVRDTNQISYPMIHFEIDEETKNITMYQGSFSAIFAEKINDYTYLCDTANGMLVIARHYSPDRIGIYEVTRGKATLKYMQNTDYNYQMALNAKGCRKGSFYAYAWSNNFRINNSTVTNNIVVSVSNDMVNWKTETLFRRVDSEYNTPIYQLLQRNGYFYLYVVADGVLHAWKSATGDSWIELNILDYVDVKCVRSGSYVSSAYEKIRIVLKNTSSIPNDNIPYVGITDLFSDSNNWGFGQESFNNLLMQDGRFAENDEEYLGLGGWISGVPCAVYFDNMIFTPSEHNLFLLSDSYDENRGYEWIMDGDYCVPEKGKTYPYWNPTTNYVIGNIVTYGGLWKCKTGNKNQPPKEGTYWTKYKEGEN